MKPAILGGKPIRNKTLPYAKQYIDEEDLMAVNEVLKSDFLTTGPKLKEFEQTIADYVGSKYAVAFSNGQQPYMEHVMLLELVLETK